MQYVAPLASLFSYGAGRNGKRRNWDKGGWFNTRGHAKGWFWRGWVPATSANVTLALTGVAGSAGAGSVVPGNSPALIGAASAGAVNGLAGGQPLAGASSTAAVNAPAVAHNQALTGASSTAAVNAPAVAHDQALTGASSTASPGTLSPTITLALTGVAGAGAVGTVAAVTGGGSDVTIALTGVAGTGAAGTAGPQVSIATSGNSSAAATGTLIAARGHGVTGNAVTGGPGSIVASSSPALTGAVASAAVNVPAAAIAVAVGGTSGTGGAGNVVVLGGTVAALTGVTLTGDVGSLGVLITGAIGRRPGGPAYSNAEGFLRAVAGSPTRPTHQEAPRRAAGTASRRGGSAGSSGRRAGVNPAPILVSVVSRKTHGGAGDFDITLDMTALIGGAITVEPRDNSVAHRIVFTFDRAITVAGTPTSVDSLGNAFGTPSAVAVGSTVIVSITGAPDRKRAVISLASVNGNASASINVGFLIGDVNNSRFVNLADLNGISVRNGQSVTTANKQYDINLDGTVTTALDRAMATLNSGTSI